MSQGTGPFGDALLGNNNEILQESRVRPTRDPPVPPSSSQTLDYDIEGQSVNTTEGDCGRKYRTVDAARMCGEPETTIACCPKNIPSDEDWHNFRELMLKKCKKEQMTECDLRTLRELRYKFGIMSWGFSPTGYSYEAGRILNRSQLFDNSIFFGREVIGSFFFFMIFVWTTSGFAANSPSEVVVIDSANVGLQQALNDLLTYQYSRDVINTHYWAYVGAVFATTMLTHLLFQTAIVECALAMMLWVFSDDGLMTANKPRWSALLMTIAGQPAGFALAGCLTLAIGHDSAAFDSLQFTPTPAYVGNGVDFLFENTGCFIIALGWIATLVVPRSLIKQFYAFQVVIPFLITIFHAVAKALTIHTTVGALGIWTYVFVSLFCSGFGKSVWIYLLSPFTAALMAGVVWFFLSRYMYSFGGNKLGKMVVRLNF